MQAVTIGDPHFDGGLSRLIDGHEHVIVAEMNKPVAWAAERQIRNVFILGDVCEFARMSYESNLAFDAFIESHPQMRFFAIPGNHDMYSENPDNGHSMELLIRMSRKYKNFHLFLKPRTVNIDDARVRFLPFPHTSFDPNALNIFHKEVKGSQNDAGRINDEEGLSVSKAVGISGHLHTPHRVRNTWYSGTLYQDKFGQSLDKSFLHVDFRSPRDYDIDVVPTQPEYLLHTVVIESRADLKKIPQGPRNLVKLVINDGADVDAADWAAMPNVIKHNRFRNAAELASVVAEDLVEGEALRIRTYDFLLAHMEAQGYDEAKQKRLMSLRRRKLKEARSNQTEVRQRRAA